MPARYRDSLLSLAASISFVTAPFLIAASAIVLGIGAYRFLAAGPRGEPAGFASAWEVIAPAWPLYLTAVLLSLLGLVVYRKLRRPAPGPPTVKEKGAEELLRA